MTMWFLWAKVWVNHPVLNLRIWRDLPRCLMRRWSVLLEGKYMVMSLYFVSAIMISFQLNKQTICFHATPWRWVNCKSMMSTVVSLFSYEYRVFNYKLYINETIFYTCSECHAFKIGKHADKVMDTETAVRMMISSESDTINSQRINGVWCNIFFLVPCWLRNGPPRCAPRWHGCLDRRPL